VPDQSRTKWFLRWLASSPSRWLGRGSGVGQDLTGGSHGLSYLRHLARGNRTAERDLYTGLDPKAKPLLLLHGFLGTRGSMYALERRLLEDGFCVFSYNLGTLNTRDIRRSAFLIHRKIESVLAHTSWDEIDIVGHSMGGLIGLYYVKKLGGHSRVRKLVMMGTPVRGTWVALVGVGLLGLYSTSSWQLLPRSRFLDELARGPVPSGVELYTIAAARDWVCPPDSTRMPGAKATTVPLGHSSLVVSDDVYRRLHDILRSDERSLATDLAPGAGLHGDRDSTAEAAAEVPEVPDVEEVGLDEPSARSAGADSDR
jgi:pimeloyl-ACP methyl ester carboxylesterase